MANKKKKHITKYKRIHLFSSYSYVEDCAKTVNMSGTEFLKKPRKSQDEVAAGNLVRRYLELDSEIARMLNGLDRKNFPAETKACSVVSGSLNDMYTELIDIMMNSTDGIEDDFETEFHDGVRNAKTLEIESEKVSEGIGELREMAEGRHSYTETMNAVEFTMIHALRILCVLQNTVEEIHR